ncbi:uncharacterized protein C8R40DRAFT_467088 [Lentinula edodes]|uniref:uncharacterized protein n=1 Tax=Lentinula edodes TaxID=5353 RepID=UPI001E8E0752|nr:uncharacterized protein C8R40DRAFT_467088 [Lentinula edodes]KAH7880114.1 hypothetical protein C8R40DRAFT_467088 [Lentinula edodes]
MPLTVVICHPAAIKAQIKRGRRKRYCPLLPPQKLLASFALRIRFTSRSHPSKTQSSMRPGCLGYLLVSAFLAVVQAAPFIAHDSGLSSASYHVRQNIEQKIPTNNLIRSLSTRMKDSNSKSLEQGGKNVRIASDTHRNVPETARKIEILFILDDGDPGGNKEAAQHWLATLFKTSHSDDDRKVTMWWWDCNHPNPGQFSHPQTWTREQHYFPKNTGSS